MNYSASFLFLYSLMAFVMPGSTETKKELIQKYLKETIDNPNYDKRIVPDGKGGPDTPVEVIVKMTVSDINLLNEEAMDYEAQISLRQSWVDPRLQYSIPNVSKIILTDVDKIWTPDLAFGNEKEGSLHKITQPNTFCRIQPDGAILYRIKVYEKLFCEMKFHDFPHDSQRCSIKIASYGFSSKDVVLSWPENRAAGVMMGEVDFPFEIDGLKEVSHNVTLSSGEYVLLEVNMVFKRNTGFYVRRMYTPLAFFVVLSWISFWINSEGKYHRLALLLVIVYMLVTTVSELDRWIPYTPYSKASDMWIGCCETLVFTAFLECILVATFFKSEAEADSSLGKIEMSPILENEEGTSDSLKSHANQIFNTITGRRGRMSWSSNPIDRISRIIIPIIFVLFNVIYWSVYGS